jgi:hypothetical protein
MIGIQRTEQDLLPLSQIVYPSATEPVSTFSTLVWVLDGTGVQARRFKMSDWQENILHVPLNCRLSTFSTRLVHSRKGSSLFVPRFAKGSSREQP